MTVQKTEFQMEIVTQGDTGAPSVVSIKPYRNNIQWAVHFAIRARVCDQDAFANATNASIAATAGYGVQITENAAGKDLDIVSQPGVKATGTLTLSGVADDAETVTIGDSVYEFDTDDSLAGSGNVQVDVSSYATAAQGTLTIDTQVTALNTMTIGTRTWAFVPNGSADHDGEISVGTDLATCQANIVAAVNGTDGVNTPSSEVTMAAFAANDSVITASVPGAGGNSIATTENFNAGTNVFDAATLGTTTAGVSCSAANAVTALVAAVTGDSAAVVDAVDGAGDTVDVTAKVAGAAANSYATTETMANGAFGGSTLSGGVTELPGEIRVSLTDATVETMTLRLGAPALMGLIAQYNEAELEVAHAAP